MQRDEEISRCPQLPPPPCLTTPIKHSTFVLNYSLKSDNTRASNAHQMTDLKRDGGGSRQSIGDLRKESVNSMGVETKTRHVYERTLHQNAFCEAFQTLERGRCIPTAQQLYFLVLSICILGFVVFFCVFFHFEWYWLVFVFFWVNVNGCSLTTFHTHTK